jgi:hypothetical protein
VPVACSRARRTRPAGPGRPPAADESSRDLHGHDGGSISTWDLCAYCSETAETRHSAGLPTMAPEHDLRERQRAFVSETFDRYHAARSAIEGLRERGFSDEHIFVAMRGCRTPIRIAELEHRRAAASRGHVGAALGLLTGMAVGALAVATMGAPLAVAPAGALAGLLVGGFAGRRHGTRGLAPAALMLPARDKQAIEDAVAAGRTVVLVSDSRSAEAASVLAQFR